MIPYCPLDLLQMAFGILLADVSHLEPAPLTLSPGAFSHTQLVKNISRAHIERDSEDQREAVSARAAREKKLVSQSTKKAMKNCAALPLTAGLRTLSELTTERTKAGLDPSRIQEGAEMLAKVAGTKRKRQREEEDTQMDADEDADMGEEAEEEWMDVDGEEAPRSKKAKANSGPVVAKGARHPWSNRQLAAKYTTK